MLVYELVHVLEPAIHKRFPDRRETLIAVALLSGLVLVLMTAAIIGLIVFFNSDAGSVSALLAKMAEILESSQGDDAGVAGRGKCRLNRTMLQEAAVQWLRAHSAAVQLAGAEVGRALLYVLIGMVLGAMIALHEALPGEPHRALANALIERAARLGSAFRRVVFAQVRISLLNTFLPGSILALILPLFGVDLPLKKTLIAVTFITGLLPVLGTSFPIR